MSNIKINDVPQRIQYLATGGQTQFTVPFPFFQNNFIYVWLNGVQLFMGGSPGEYTVSGAGSPSGGLVTFNTAATLNDIVTIEGFMPIDRTSIYSATISNLTGSDLNGDFNREVVMLQQLNTVQSFLQLQYAPWTEISQDLAVTTDRYIPLLPAGYGWRKNMAGTAIEAIAIPDGGFAPQVGSFVTISDERSDLPNSFPLFDLGNASTSGMGIPAGTTAQRVVPTAPNIGLRFNTDLGVIEAYIGGSWVEIPSSAAGLFLPLAGGTMSGDILMDANFIKDLPSPVDPDDAATKDYVDSVIGSAAGGVSGNIQWNDGGVFGGDPNFNTDGSGNVSIDGSLDVDNLSFNGNRISATTGLVELEDSQLFNDMDADSNKIINLLSPTAGTDAANKAYVDSVAAGFFFLEPVLVASTANFTSTYNNGTAGVGATLTATSNGAASIDGVSLSLNDRVLFKNQSTTYENGIYYVSQVGDGSNPAIYTRALDYDEPSDIDPGDMAAVLQGTANASTFWVETAVVATIGTDPITFTQFGVSAGNVVTISGAQTITGDKTFTGLTIGVGGLKSFQIFTSGTAQTYTKPAGITSILVEVVGAGGGGGGGAGGANLSLGSAGGGGGYSRLWVPVAASSYTYTVGQAGTAGTSGGGDGGAGGTTTFSAGSLQATGGDGGRGSVVSATVGRIITSVGGIGSGGDINVSGGAGGETCWVSGVAMPSPGGNSALGGAAACPNVGAGIAAGNYGGGGSGAVCAGVSFAGGAGAPGLIVVWEFS